MPQRIRKGQTFCPQTDLIAYSKEEIDCYNQKKERKRQATLYYTEHKERTKKLGGFTFLKNNFDKLKDLNPATAGRLAYLSIYLAFDSQRLLNDNEPIKKKHLPYILNISKSTADKFYNECVAADLLYDNGESGLYLTEAFYRNNSSNKNRVKLYKRTIQQMYKKLPPTKHRYFGYVVQLVPLINFEWNVVCHNPQETNRYHLQPLSFKEVCKELGYEYTNSGELRKALTSPIFEWQGYKQALCGFFEMNTEYGTQKSMVVNPNILFAGTHLENIGILEVVFIPKKPKVKTT